VKKLLKTIFTRPNWKLPMMTVTCNVKNYFGVNSSIGGQTHKILIFQRDLIAIYLIRALKKFKKDKDFQPIQKRRIISPSLGKVVMTFQK